MVSLSPFHLHLDSLPACARLAVFTARTFLTMRGPVVEEKLVRFFPSHLQQRRRFIWITNARGLKAVSMEMSLVKAIWSLVPHHIRHNSDVPGSLFGVSSASDPPLSWAPLWIMKRIRLVFNECAWILLFSLSTSCALKPAQMPPSISLGCWQSKAVLLLTIPGPLCVCVCVASMCVCPSVVGRPSVQYCRSLLALRLPAQQPTPPHASLYGFWMRVSCVKIRATPVMPIRAIDIMTYYY